MPSFCCYSGGNVTDTVNATLSLSLSLSLWLQSTADKKWVTDCVYDELIELGQERVVVVDAFRALTARASNDTTQRDTLACG